MHFPEDVLFISGKRIEESNSACEGRHIVVGHNGPYKSTKIIMADGNELCTCLFK